MATVINNPGETTSGAGVIVGVVVAVILIALLFIYGLPALRGTKAASNTSNTTPGASTNIDVNLGGGGGTTNGTGTGSGY